MTARHRKPDTPARPDARPDRIGAHEPTPFRELTPAAALLARLRNTPKETR